MKIVQSFWTKPIFEADGKGGQNDRFSGGWVDNLSHFMSWTLSCLQLKKFYPTLELVTDDLGKELLIDQLQLPYSSVSLALNDLEDANPSLWAQGKMAAYSLQEKPFIHVDGDVYIFERFSPTIEEAELLCQSFDFDHKEYFDILNAMDKEKFRIPFCIEAERRSTKNIIATNAGILGGRNTEFFKEYCFAAGKLIKDNVKKLSNVDIPSLNIVFEQYLFYCLAKHRGTPITSLLSDGHPRHYVKFEQVPYRTTYIHMISHFKRSSLYIEKMKSILRMEHPEHYYFLLAHHGKTKQLR